VTDLMRSNQRLDVAGLGNALIDALVRVDDERILDTLDLKRGQMHPVDHETWQRAYDLVAPLGIEIQSGGSCANTVATLGLMGLQGSYCGQVGDDEYGTLYGNSLMECCGQHELSKSAAQPTGKCLSIISGVDAERTLLSDLGAAVTMSQLGDFREVIRSSRVLHITGYLLLGDPMRQRAFEAIHIANDSGVKVSLDVADPFVVGAVGSVMWDAIELADIVFCNEMEAMALCGGTPKDALSALSESVDTVVVKLGSRGSLISHMGQRYTVGIHPVSPVDTTGAGDAYAAGFLYGLLAGWSPDRAGDLGSRIAALTVGRLGAVVRDRVALAQAIRAVTDTQE